MPELVILHEDFTGKIRTYIKPDGTPIVEITTVGGWVPVWLEGEGPRYLRPEMHIIDQSDPKYLTPIMRLNNAGCGIKIHKQWGLIDAGYYRQTTVPAGVAWLHAHLRGHCWYSEVDQPVKSLYKRDGLVLPCTEGMRLWIGIDPTGGTNLWADTVEWAWEDIFDVHDSVYLAVDAPGPLVTVFIRTDNDYGFKHVDAYFASVDLYGYTDDPEDPDPLPDSALCRGAPREQYERRYWLLSQDASRAEFLDVAALAYPSRGTVGFSADDAGLGDLDSRTVAVVDTPTAQWNEELLLSFFEEHYPGVMVEFHDVGMIPDPEPKPPGPEPPTPKPHPVWTPRNYVPTGTKLGFHAAGDGGQTGDVFKPLAPLGAQPPTAKVIVSLGAAKDIKAIDPSVVMIGRMIDVLGYGNVEGFNYNDDLFRQAVWHMNAVQEAFGPHRQYFDYVEVINEQDPPSATAHVNLATFFMHCMLIAKRLAFRLALFSHSVGTPEPAAWDAIANTGVFEMAAAGGHAISLHEYNLNGIGGCLYRYRYLYEQIILPRHLDIPLYITEYNVDVADASNADLMFANWIAYDAEVSRDPYVAGVHIYSTGQVDSSYRPTIYSLWNRYRAYAISVKDRINA